MIRACVKCGILDDELHKVDIYEIGEEYCDRCLEALVRQRGPLPSLETVAAEETSYAGRSDVGRVLRPGTETMREGLTFLRAEPSTPPKRRY